MFSSTVVSLKLIPTTTLHHKHKGEMMTSVLLFQDILAIILILLITGGESSNALFVVPLLLIKVTVVTAAAFIAVKYIILPLFKKFDIIQEYVFLMSLGWCLGIAEIAKLIGLSYEMGAFVAGLSLASSPIAWVIAEKLKPLREFFLILFFFSIGAKFDYLTSKSVLVPGIILTVVLMVIKPIAFKFEFIKSGENETTAKELGIRLGQASEFSILLATAAFSAGKISNEASFLIQLVTINTFIISTYWVIKKYNTPMSISKRSNSD